MKRLLTIVPIALLAVSALAPARAAEPSEQKPIDILCQGTSGHNSSGLWKAHSSRTPIPPFLAISHCVVSSPDTARPLGPPPVDPTHPEPWWPLADWATESSPIAGLGSRIKLEAQGDFACGDGTLARANTNNFASYGQGIAKLMTWGFDWSATFEDGVGEVSGTAWKGVTYSWDSNPDEIRELSGTIVIDDGAAVGECDDSEGASDVYIHFRLS